MLCEENLSKYDCLLHFEPSFNSFNFKATPYELWKCRKSNISYFYIFRCHCFVLNNEKDNLGKFDAKSYEDFFLGYSTCSKIYRIFNKWILIIEESIHIVFDEVNNSSSRKEDTSDDVGILENGIKKHSLKKKPTQDGGGETKDNEVLNLKKSINKEHEIYLKNGGMYTTIQKIS